MQEEFLHYVWKHQKLNLNQLYTSSGERIDLVSPGRQNFESGPDFIDARIRIDGQLWAGNVEMHLQSSEWYRHNHQYDKSYNNVILHVVWQHDMEVILPNEQAVPTLEIKTLITPAVIQLYTQLKSTKSPSLPCVSFWPEMSQITLQNWLERLYIERLELKYKAIVSQLNSSQNDWEAVLFQLLLKNFGLKTNGQSFEALARSVPFKVIQKIAHDPDDLEAVLMGQSGLLLEKPSDAHCHDMQMRYHYLKRKFDLNASVGASPKFFRLRPPNFPTLRLSQFARLWSSKKSLFSHVMDTDIKDEFYKLLTVESGSYWFNHFTFGKVSKPSKKKLTSKFIDLLLINTIIPVKFAFQKFIGNDASEELVGLISSIQKEENSLIKIFDPLTLNEQSALHSQALLHLKSVYCNTRSCLQCVIGNKMLSQRF